MTAVAYVVTSHTLPDQVLRLVRTLRELSPSAPVLVHHDGRRAALDAGELRRLGATPVPPVPAVEWGRGSQLDMLLRCLAFAVRETAFDWLTILSGQDYPLRPLEQVERELAATAFDGYVEGHLVAPPAWRRDGGDEFSRRYFYAWSRVREPTRAGRRAIAAARPLLALRDIPTGVLLGVRAPTPFGPALPCRRGSDWLTLSRRCTELVDAAAREQPGLVRFFRRTVLPTEAFPHTVLHAHPGLRLSGDVRRFTAWEPGSPHPRVLGTADLDAMLASGADVARKFDASADGAVLDELDRLLGI
jgi:Core-2/I-Branching enzyme